MTRDASLDHVYAAIADPTRRAMLQLLTGGETTVGALATRFPISLNGVSKHVKVLERAGLVRRRVAGREHWLTFDATPLANASNWLERYRGFWEDRLQSLERLLISEERQASPAPKRRRSRRRS
jgi:DNA-binding transcriptional ArsR family regulator